MSGLFNTFNIFKRAMGAQQYAINTTSHNIANANTDGYSRQRVTMEASIPEGDVSMNSAFGPGQVGTGVDARDITRARDMFLDVQIRNELSTSGRFKARDEFLSEIETILMEPSDNGISEAMGEMWDSWDRLSQNPQDSNARTGAVEASKSFADSLNHVYNQLESLKDHSNELTKGKIFDFNETIKQIEDLNRQIMAVRVTGNNPNDLMDKQDLLIDKLAEMTDIKVDRGQLGDAIITASGKTITGNNKKSLSFVSDIEKGSGNYTITYYKNGDTNQLKTITISDPDGSKYEAIKDSKVIWTDEKGSDPQKALLGGGSIKGYASIYTEINEYKNQLNALAKGIAYAVNTVHNDGAVPPNPPNSAYVPIFTAKGSQGEENIDAQNITVNMELFTNPSLLKTNGKDPVTGDPYPATNGDRALAIAQIRDSRLFINEFYESASSVTSGKIDGPVTFNGETITIRSNGKEANINFPVGTMNVDEISKKISDGLPDDILVRVSAVDGRLVIQSMKSEDNALTIDDNGSGILGDLKIYRDKNNSDVRLNNSIVDGYGKDPNDLTKLKIASDTKGTTLDSYFRDTIAKLGSSAQQAKGMVTSQDALIAQIQVKKDSVSGVSLDEEMANLIQYQNAYNAAAKAVTVVQELLDSVINLIR